MTAVAAAVRAVMRYKFVRVSGNRKTGPIPVTYTSRDSCPDSCALKGAGCYAEQGPTRWQWNKARDNFADLLAFIRSIPGGSLWRHNVAGDLPGAGDQLDADALHKIARANRGRRGFTYTHKPTTPANVAAMRDATRAGFTINLSADNAAAADNLARHGLPVVVVIPADAPKVSRTPHGRQIVQCPAENTPRITCANCGLCHNAARPYLIGFKPKGARRRVVDQLAKEGSTTP